jgi:SAM-dependent methyltransferase
MWPFVKTHLPAPPARVLELGCGAVGGFVPLLRGDGYDAIGVDPEAPAGEEYRRVRFEELEPLDGLDTVVACTSLHHVEHAADVISAVARCLRPHGTAIVVEWDWQGFDRATAEWSFRRLGPNGDEGWLHRRRDDWAASGRSWDEYLPAWAGEHGLHPAGELIRLLDERFERLHLERGPYVFPDLDATEEDERAAIAASEIRATRIDYVGRLRNGA